MNIMKPKGMFPGRKKAPMKASGSNPTLNKVASGKPLKQAIQPVKTDRGSFGIKG